jgi:hypothetical protein
MAQMPINDDTFADFFDFKNKAIQERNGKLVTWDQVMKSIIKVGKKYEKEFLTNIKDCVMRKHEK